MGGACRSPDDKIDVVVGDGDDHVGHVVGGVQVALHGGPEGTTHTHTRRQVRQENVGGKRGSAPPRKTPPS